MMMTRMMTTTMIMMMTMMMMMMMTMMMMTMMRSGAGGGRRDDDNDARPGGRSGCHCETWHGALYRARDTAGPSPSSTVQPRARRLSKGLQG